MRKRFLASALSLLSAAALALAEPPSPSGAPAATQPFTFASSILADPTVGSDPCRGDDCCLPACAPCGCGPYGRAWVSAEYLYWWTKGTNIPPLVTSGNAANAIPGALGQPGTSILLGNNFASQGQSGGRFNAGFWLNDSQTVGFEAGYLFLGSRTNSFIAGSSGAPGSPVIARPFLDETNAAAPFQNSEIVAFPGVASGTVSVNNTTSLQGVGANGLCNLCCFNNCCGGYRIDAIGGFNWMQLNGGLTVTENITVLPGAPAPLVPGSMFTVLDRFSTQNNFYGPQLGLRGWWWRDRFFVNAFGIVALGDNNQQVTRSGATAITAPGGATVVDNGGLLVQATNSGTVNRNQLSFIPQIGANVGYMVTQHVWAYVGYTFLYWNNVAQPGDQIDQGINTTQVPRFGGTGPLVGTARPAPVVNETDFWAQGINLGVMFRY